MQRTQQRMEPDIAAESAEQCTFNACYYCGSRDRPKRQAPRGFWPARGSERSATFLENLTISCDRTELARQEVIRGPRPADRHFAVFQLLGSGAVAVLILLHALGVDQVGDVDQHSLGSDLLTADFFFQRVKRSSCGSSR